MSLALNSLRKYLRVLLGQSSRRKSQKASFPMKFVGRGLNLFDFLSVYLPAAGDVFYGASHLWKAVRTQLTVTQMLTHPQNDQASYFMWIQRASPLKLREVWENPGKIFLLMLHSSKACWSSRPGFAGLGILSTPVWRGKHLCACWAWCSWQFTLCSHFRIFPVYGDWYSVTCA